MLGAYYGLYIYIMCDGYFIRSDNTSELNDGLDVILFE